MNSRKEKADKSMVIKSEFHYGQTRQMVSIGERQYDTTKLTRASQKRLLAVIESIPLNCHHTQFDTDFSPVVFLHWKVARGDAGLFPAAHPREVLGDEYSAYRNAVDMAERITAQAWVLPEASLELAKHVIRDGSTASTVIIGKAFYGFDTPLYAVIYETCGRWHLVAGWLKFDDTLCVVHACTFRSVALARQNFHFSHRDAELYEVAI